MTRTKKDMKIKTVKCCFNCIFSEGVDKDLYCMHSDTDYIEPDNVCDRHEPKDD